MRIRQRRITYVNWYFISSRRRRRRRRKTYLPRSRSRGLKKKRGAEVAKLKVAKLNWRGKGRRELCLSKTPNKTLILLFNYQIRSLKKKEMPLSPRHIATRRFKIASLVMSKKTKKSLILPFNY